MNTTDSNTNRIKKVGISDFILIGLIIALAVFFFFFNKSGSENNLYVSVSLDGEEIYSQNLYEIDTPFEYKIDGDIDMILLLEKDGVTVTHSDCPDKLCVNMGKLTKSGECAVCLPARVSVRLYSYDQNSELDGVTR